MLRGRRSEPPLDSEGETELEVVSVTVERGWTSVTFERLGLGTDDSVSGEERSHGWSSSSASRHALHAVKE